MKQSRLHELERQCIQESAPPCTALCPLHVDIRQMTAAVSAGDFAGGYKILRKSVPFPEIIARTCDQPCKSKCNRETLGGVIRVADIERACVEFSNESAPKIPLLPKKKFRVVVIGGGLSGLTAVFDLARKGYQVDVYEQRDHLGGRLWDFEEERLPRDVLLRETNLAAQIGAQVHLGERVNLTDKVVAEADAVYLGSGESDSAPEVNPVTFQVANSKIFAGGSMFHPYSSALSISDGRRAAISMDRFLQKVSLTASRVNEGAYETRLYTNLTNIAAVEVIPPRGAYTKKESQSEAARCIQCECLECVKVCPYLEHYGSHPRKYARDIYNNMSMLARARTANQFINTCALCGLCAEVCPTKLDMGQVCYETRQEMVSTSKMPAAAHDFALRDMAFSNGEKFALAKNAPVGGRDSASLRPYDMRPNEYVFFPGCQLSGSSPEYVEKSYSFLRETFNNDVGLMLRCCGAPADWAARKDLFAKSQAEFYAEHEKLGKPKVILSCSSCYQMFQKHYPDVEIISFWDVMNEHGKFTKKEFAAPITIHDPCSTRYEDHIQDSIRNIITKLGGEIQELPLSREKTECCSFGGVMWLANRPVAEKMVQRRISESKLDYVTYCAMCRDFFARKGKRTLHIFDYIFGEEKSDLAAAPAVGFSQRHENRARLKEKLLRELWSETMPDAADFESILLVLPADVEKQVEDRLILVEDMQKVIEYAERTGKRMLNNSTKHYLAYFKPTSVTYWVEYTKNDDGSFHVYKAYSHRMEVGIGASK